MKYSYVWERSESKTWRQTLLRTWVTGALASCWSKYKVLQLLGRHFHGSLQNCTFTTSSNSPVPGYWPRLMKNFCLEKNLCIHFYSGFLHSCSNLKTIKIFSRSWTGEEWTVNPREEETCSHFLSRRGRNQYMLLSERSQSEQVA